MALAAAATDFSAFLIEGVEDTGKELGRGAYATVTRLIYRGLPCAGKKLYGFLRCQREGKPDTAFERFKTECSLLSQLRHPNVVQFLGVYFEQDVPVLVTECLPMTLAECLERYGVFPEQVSYSVLRGVALGLVYLHGHTPQPIIHRDMSANNILLSENLVAKIADLGEAKILNRTPRMSQAPGTLEYMPPEALVVNPEYDTKIDVFSYGVLIIHVLCGRCPTPTAPAVNPRSLQGVSEVERRDQYLREIGRDHSLMATIRQCLSNNPASRPNAAEILRRVSRVADSCRPTHANKLEMLHSLQQAAADCKSLRDDVSRLTCEAQQQLLQRKTAETNLAALRLSSRTKADQLCLQIDQLTTQNDLLKRDLRATKELLDTKVQAAGAELEAQVQEASRQLRSLEERSRVEKEKEVKELQMKLILKDNQRRDQVKEKEEEMRVKLDEKERECNTRVQEQEREANVKVEQVQREMNTLRKELAIRDASLKSHQSLLATKEDTIQRLVQQLCGMQEFLSSSPSGMSLVDPSAKLKWKEYPAMPARFTVPRAIVVGSRLYVAGFSQDGAPGGFRIYSLEFICNVWEQLPNVPVEASGLARLSGNLVTVGGASRDGRAITDVYTYRYESKTWEQSLPSLNVARSYPVCVSTEETIVACGGGMATNSFNRSVEVINNEMTQWTVVSGCSLPNEWIMFWTATAFQNVAVFLGGSSRTSSRPQVESELSKDVFCLPLSSIRSLPKCPAAMVEWQRMQCAPHVGSLAVSIGGSLLALGGVKTHKKRNEKESKMIHMYLPQSDTWLYIGDMPLSLASPVATAAVVSSTELFILTGEKVFKCTLQLTE